MGDKVKVHVTGTVDVSITWPEVARALCSSVALAGTVDSEITDKQLEHLESVIGAARQRLREKGGG